MLEKIKSILNSKNIIFSKISEEGIIVQYSDFKVGIFVENNFVQFIAKGYWEENELLNSGFEHELLRRLMKRNAERRICKWGYDYDTGGLWLYIDFTVMGELDSDYFLAMFNYIGIEAKTVIPQINSKINDINASINF